MQDKIEGAIATEREDLWVHVNPSKHEKCARCWHHQEDVNQNPEYPSLCNRSLKILTQVNQGSSFMLKKLNFPGLKWLIGVPLLVLLDQISKWWVIKHLSFGESIPVFPGFNITLNYNKGDCL